MCALSRRDNSPRRTRTDRQSPCSHRPTFLTHLAVEGHVAASTQNQALAGLLFLYRVVLERDFGWLDDVVRAKKPKRLPVVFTVDEAKAVIEELQGMRWLMAMLLYGGRL